MMKKLLLCLFSCSLFLNAMAIHEEQAVLVAQNFLKERKIGEDHPLSKISLQEIVTKEDITVFYIFSLGDDAGFVIVSGSEYESPIIGFSFEHEFQWQPAIQYFLDMYSNHILLEERSKNIPDKNVTKQWCRYLQEAFLSSVVLKEVKALITSHWNQNKFYNTYCPWDWRAITGFDGRVPNGCVALATAQLMNYYRHPETGRLGVAYTPRPYPPQTVIFSQHQYHWDAMCDQATNYTNEIAKLAYHVGVAVEMQYAPGGSGAFTNRAAEVLNENFFYNDYMQWSGFDQVRIKEQIDLLQPILMSGSNSSGGHAFLVDGYSEIEGDPVIQFHFNWGWGGNSDGYYTLREQLFPKDATVFFNIIPARNYPVQCEEMKKQTAFEGYVTNGSTNKPYQSNPDCSWIIAAPGAKRYTFSFARLDTKENVDIVTIYNGGTKSSSVAVALSGNKIPTQPIEIIADSVLITFTSKDPSAENTKHLGFLMNYVTDKPQQKCEGVTYLTAPSGYITDGSELGENYTPWVSCTWNINSFHGTGFFGLFHEFDLKLGDFIDIYNTTNSESIFWTRYDRYNKPTVGEVISFPFSKIQMSFITDNFDEGKGFKFQYFSLLGINDNSLLDDLTISPNPASDVIFLAFSSEKTNQNITCSLVDLAGKEVYSQKIEYICDIYATQIPVEHLAKGLYFLNLTTTTGKSTSKIIIY